MPLKNWKRLEHVIALSEHISVEGREFYIFSMWGNLLFTPEEVEKARQQFKEKMVR